MMVPRLTAAPRPGPYRTVPHCRPQVGLMLAVGVDAVQWRRLTDDLPELVPRGAPGWQLYA